MEDEMGRACGCRILVLKPGERQLGSSVCWLVDNIKMDLREVGWGGVESE
jgi:hypothetical protein